MSPSARHTCQCERCQQDAPQPEQQLHREINEFMACLHRSQRRLYAAVEANRLGRGGARLVAQITGLGEETIRAGRPELAECLTGELRQPPKPRGGRPRVESKYPAIMAALEELLADEVGGHPMSDQKWVRVSVKWLTKQLRGRSFQIGGATVWRLLKRMGFSMKLNVRKRRGNKPDSPERDGQFTHIASMRKEYMDAGLPVISIDRVVEDDAPGVGAPK